MRKYVKPAYEMEGVETADVILASASVLYVGEGTLGNIKGPKVEVSSDYEDLFAVR